MTTSRFVRLIGLMAEAPAHQLAALLARGDRRGAAAMLVRTYAPAVFGLCRAMVRDSQLAEDLSQDTFARAFAALDGFRGEASPRTWLLKIARNRCLDHLDRAKRAPWGTDPDPEPDAVAIDELPPVDLLAQRDDAERAMAVLGESERALIVLHFGHGVGYPELADAFGAREGAIRMRVSRALARMRAELVRGDETFEDLEQCVVEPEAVLDEECAELDDLDLATTARTPATAYDVPPAGLWSRLDALARRL